jgi:hypothetical protein
MLCNYCSYQSIKRNKKKDERISKLYEHGGVSIFVHPKDVRGSARFEKDSEGDRIYFKAWFMKLPDSCAC